MLAVAAVVLALLQPGAAGADPATAAHPAAGRAAAGEAAAVQVYPAPGSHTVSAGSQISFRGIAGPAAITVRGSVSGLHAGHWLAHSDHVGASFIPDAAFASGEQVTVTSGLDIGGAAGGTFSYLIARPGVLPPTSKSVYDEPAAPPVARPDAGAPNAGARQTLVATAPFHSRPDLRPPTMAISSSAPGPAPGLLLTSPDVPTTTSDPGSLIYDNQGQPVWFLPSPANGLGNLTRTRYRGQDVLTYFQGTSVWQGGYKGQWVVLDNTYTPIAIIAAGNGYLADGHEMQLTAAGDKALLEIYNPVQLDLTPYGGAPNATVLEAVVQEVDVATGAVTFEWHSLADSPVTDTLLSLVRPADPLAPQIVDYFHINSMAYDTDGNILASGRHVSEALKIRRSGGTGTVLWTLGGKHSTYAFPTPSDAPSWPHDVRRRADGTVSVYDNGVGRTPPYGRGVAWRLDDSTTPPTATATQVLDHGRDLFGPIVGSNRQLANGDELVSFGNTGTTTEYDGTGAKVWESRMQGGAWTYRTVKTVNWHATPARAPDLAVDRSANHVTAYASWNGATDVADWRLLAGPTADSLAPTGPTVARTGFETSLSADVSTGDNVFVVEARDDTGQVIGRSTLDPIADKYRQLGVAASVLGPPVGTVTAVGGGITQAYVGGLIAWSAATGAHEVHGTIGQHYGALGGPGGFLGFPTTDETAVPDGVGRVSGFAGGDIYWTPQSDAHEVHGNILGKYGDTGGPTGLLGYPVTDELATPDGVGRYNHFTGGSVYWTDSTGAHEVHGNIRDHWAAIGWERSVLGYPTSDEIGTQDRVGRFNNFSSGVMYWTPTTGAHEVHGSILVDYAALGFERSVLGYPTTDETVTPDGVGRYNHFTLGSVYWSPSTGAWEVHGAIQAHWEDLSWELGVLGYPLSNELPAPDGIGRFNYFTGGSMYWTAATGAHEVQGVIRERWGSLGYERGALGYPVSDEYDIAHGRRSDFQGGSILWDRVTGATTVVGR